MSTHPTGFQTGQQGRTHALPAGVVLGNYTILKTIGQGGFGITYLAVDATTQAEVVIKENLPSFYALRDQTSLTVTPLAGEESTRGYKWSLERFLDEARTLAKLNHPNIVRVLTAFSALETAYYVMPVVHGGSMAEAAPPPYHITEAWLSPILQKLLGALAYLHSHALLHRDLKPANILIDRNGEPIIIDFGTARSMISERSQTMIGTPGFTPVEQMQNNGHPGPWTDIYALGATCYRLITGQNPPSCLDRLAQDTLRPLHSIPELQNRFSQPFLQAIDKALFMRSEQRWQNAQEWLNAINFPSQADFGSHAPMPYTGHPSLRMDKTEVIEEDKAKSSGSTGLIITILLLVLLLGGGGAGVAFYLLEQQKAEEAQRRAEEQFRAAEAMTRAKLAQAEVERQLAEEKARREEEARKAEERRREEEARRAEERRREEEARREEQRRQEEARRREEEEARKREEEAARRREEEEARKRAEANKRSAYVQMVREYLDARAYGQSYVLSNRYADTVQYKYSNYRNVSRSTVLVDIEKGWNRWIYRSYSLHSIGVRGNVLEIVYRFDLSEGSGRKTASGYTKETWHMNDNGQIYYWDEVINKNYAPSLSPGMEQLY